MAAMSSPKPTPGGEPVPAKKTAGRNLPVAIASGLLLAGTFLGTLFFSVAAFLVFWSLLIVVALFELDKAFRTKGLRPALPVAIGSGLVILFGAYYSGPTAQSLGLVLLLLGAMAWTLLDADRSQVAASLGATCLMGLWVPFLASFVGPLLTRPNGIWYVMAAVALVVTGDIGAYGFGYGFGKHKMAPTISPAKTWEGFAGGWLTVLVIAALITSRVPGFDLTLALVFGTAVFLAGTVGDLAESMVKRDLGVKDLGGIVPGHGGIMDRADAIIFALPVAHAILSLFGR